LTERQCGTPIVFLTGSTDAGREGVEGSGGGHAILRKPVGEAELLTALASALEAPRPPR